MKIIRDLFDVPDIMVETSEVKEILDEDVCLECGGTNIIRDKYFGEVVCGSCGLVISDSIVDMSPEWRAFTPDQKEARSRAGLPTSFSVHDNDLTTIIGRVDYDALGRKIPHKTKLQMLRLRKCHTRSRFHSSVDRNLSKAMDELERLTDKLHIPLSVKEEAAAIYRKALEKNLVKGRSISTIMTASLYAACRLTHTQRTLKEVSQQSAIDIKEVSRCYNLLVKELGLRMPIPTPQLNVPKLAARMSIGERTQRMAVEILQRAGQVKETTGKDPMAIAAAALYIACGMNNEKQTQKIIGEAAGVTEVTIRNRYKSLKKIMNLNI